MKAIKDHLNEHPEVENHFGTWFFLTVTVAALAVLTASVIRA